MLTFLELQGELIPSRFDASLRDRVKKAINGRYSWVWAQEDWPFKYGDPAQFGVIATGDTEQAAFLPDTLAMPEKIQDDQGNELEYLEPIEYHRRHFNSDTETGRPSAWTWERGKLLLDPTPDTSYEFLLVEWRRIYGHLNAAGAFVAGNMSLDTDQAAWSTRLDDRWLAAGAAAALLKDVSDPTWGALEDEFDAGYAALVAEMLPDKPLSEPLQYGRDQL